MCTASCFPFSGKVVSSRGDPFSVRRTRCLSSTEERHEWSASPAVLLSKASGLGEHFHSSWIEYFERKCVGIICTVCHQGTDAIWLMDRVAAIWCIRT